MNWISQHKILFGALVIAVVITVWYGLSQSGTSRPTITTVAPTSPTAEGDQQLVSTLLALRAVTLTGTIFADPSFTSLHDNGTTIVTEPVGRDNPFAPLQIAADTSATSTHQAQIFAPKH